MVYRVLGKLLWKGGLPKTEIIIIHRGAPENKKTIPGRSVTEVKKSYLVYVTDVDEETTVPLHRIMEVRFDGKIVWKRVRKAYV